MLTEMAMVSRQVPLRAAARPTNRRSALLAALEHELGRRTLAEISITAVTRRAGLGRSAFYFYFPSKYAAVTELLEGVYDELVAMASDLVNGVGSPRASLTSALGDTVAIWHRHRILFCAMVDAVAADPEARTVWKSWMQMFEDFMVRAASEQQWPIALPAGVDLRATVSALLDMNQHVLGADVRAVTDAEGGEGATALMTHVWTTTLFGPEAR